MYRKLGLHPIPWRSLLNSRGLGGNFKKDCLRMHMNLSPPGNLEYPSISWKNLLDSWKNFPLLPNQAFSEILPPHKSDKSKYNMGIPGELFHKYHLDSKESEGCNEDIWFNILLLAVNAWANALRFHRGMVNDFQASEFGDVNFNIKSKLWLCMCYRNFSSDQTWNEVPK